MIRHQKNIFKGLKVLELASVLAGPAVGMFFAELGEKSQRLRIQKLEETSQGTGSRKVNSEKVIQHTFQVSIGERSI